jgi:hypothetical protein
MYVIAKIAPQNREKAEAALLPLLNGPMMTLEEAAPLPLPVERVDEALAQKIAEAIRPTPKRPIREEVLRALARGYDSLADQEGEPDPQMRNGFGALSKALRPFTARASPIELIAVRRRRYQVSGPYRGSYESTTYALNPLGKRAFEILRKQGVAV